MKLGPLSIYADRSTGTHKVMLNTPDRPHPSLLDRYAIAASNPTLIGHIDNAFSMLIDQMTWIYARVMQRHDSHLLALAPLQLYRHVIEHIDAVHILTLQTATSPAKLHLRSALEAHLYLVFMATEDWKFRAACHTVCSYEEYRRQLVSSSRNHDLGVGIEGTPTPDHVVAERLKDTDRFLASPELAPAVAAYNDARRGRGHPVWFQLVDPSLRSRRDLANHLNYSGRYQLFQSWSQVVHPDHTFTNLEFDMPDGRASVRYLRDGIDAEQVVGAACALGTETAERILLLFRAEEVPDFHEWVERAVKPAFNTRIDRHYGATPPLRR